MQQASRQHRPARAGQTARGAAVDLLTGVVAGGRSLADLVAAEYLATLAPADRARAQRLALSTLRHWRQAGDFLAPFLRRGPPPEVDAVLRLAVTEIHVEGVPAHDAVNAAVAEIRARGRRIEGFGGLANAVLRKAAGRTAADWAAHATDELPGWLRGRLLSAYGRRAVAAMAEAHRRGALVDVTPRETGQAAAIAAALGGTVLPTGSIRLPAGGQISALPGHADGTWWVQDAAAALPARALGELRGRRVLDLCAAPGGKTLQLAAAGAMVTAVDISAQRMERVRENLARCRLAAELVLADALDWTPPGRFDAVLLDAPCSATGTIRRHPDLPFVRSPEGLRALVQLQARLIDRLPDLVRPGGICVYATCSLLPEEGERQIAAALGRLAGWAVAPPDGTVPGLDAEWIGPDGGIRVRPDFWPEYGGLDGFYFAVLRSPA
ncbi:MAG: methyltransferase domain-containing protein [Rhodobacteraceae bacterium]|nr:methyltransferase domain-containing protein [Paracoccaceae bacterium]